MTNFLILYFVGAFISAGIVIGGSLENEHIGLKAYVSVCAFLLSWFGVGLSIGMTFTRLGALLETTGYQEKRNQ